VCVCVCVCDRVTVCLSISVTVAAFLRNKLNINFVTAHKSDTYYRPIFITLCSLFHAVLEVLCITLYRFTNKPNN